MVYFMHSLCVKNVYILPFYESDNLAGVLNKFHFPYEYPLHFFLLTLDHGKLYINKVLLFGFLKGFAKERTGSRGMSSLTSILVGVTVVWISLLTEYCSVYHEALFIQHCLSGFKKLLFHQSFRPER